MSGNTRAKNTRSKDFRYIYANGMAIQFSGNELTLILGIKEDQSVSDENIMEEVAVVMTPTTAKLLSETLTRMIEHFERTAGFAIPLEATKMAQLDAILAATPVTPPPNKG